MVNPKISFGIIVLNGEPFTKYCLRQIYPLAHEIIVVEGASQYARDVADENGHSLDGTLRALWEFKEQEDPEDKVKIISVMVFGKKRMCKVGPMQNEPLAIIRFEVQ